MLVGGRGLPGVVAGHLLGLVGSRDQNATELPGVGDTQLFAASSNRPVGW